MISLCQSFQSLEQQKTSLECMESQTVSLLLQQQKLKRIIKIIVPFFISPKRVILLARRQGVETNTGDLSCVSEVTRATANYYWITLVCLCKGQELRFFHYIFGFKMGLLKEIGGESRWKLTDEDQVQELYIARESWTTYISQCWFRRWWRSSWVNVKNDFLVS